VSRKMDCIKYWFSYPGMGGGGLTDFHFAERGWVEN